MYGILANIYVYIIEGRVPVEAQREGIGSLGLELQVIVSYSVDVEKQTLGPLEEQPELLTTESSLGSQIAILPFMFSMGINGQHWLTKG